MTKTAMRFLLPATIAAGFLVFAGSGCELIASVDRTKISGAGGAGATGGGGDGGGGEGGGCDAATCDAMDQECVDFSCNAENTGCDDGVPVAEDQPCLITTDNVCNADGQCVPVCDPAACDAMDQECLDFSCNAENTACDTGVTVNPGDNCLMTTADICNDNGVCVPVGCTNMFMDGEETDVDCGGSMCDGCDNGLTCNVNSDCRSNNCDTNNNTCVPCSDSDCSTVPNTFCDDEDPNVAEQVCKPQLANGSTCDVGTHGDEECVNDNCVDGVCCDGGCAGTCESCNQAGLLGLCTLIPMGMDPDTECPASNAQCRAGGCSGNANTCQPAASNVECRAAAGLCDVAENCSGTGTGCPMDILVGAGMTCRAAAGVCDAPETCDGNNPACPTDAKLTTECRASTGACDLAETCDGAGNDCPPDTNFAPNTTVCRPAAGVCDAVENCTGSSNTCPGDMKLTSECRASTGACDLAENCDGAADTCPPDTNFAPSTTVCRPAADDCDAVENCTGASNNCPADIFEADGTQVAACDPYLCDGAVASCPSTCAADTDCVMATHFCSMGNTCEQKLANGESCFGNNECISNNCAGGTCAP